MFNDVGVDRRRPARSTTAPSSPASACSSPAASAPTRTPRSALEEFTAREDLLPTHRGDPAGVRPRRQPRQQAAGPHEVARRHPRASTSCSAGSSRSARFLLASSTWPGGIPDEVAEARRRAGRRRRRRRRPRPSARARPVPHRVGTTPYERWEQANVVRGAAKGTVSAYAYAPARRHHLRPVPRRSPRSSASSAPRCASPTARTSCSAASTEEQLPTLFDRLDAIGMAEPGAELARDVVACPGADTCNLAVTQSPRPGRRHRRRARGGGPGRGRRHPHQHLRLHQLLRPAPHRRHRLLRRRAPGPRQVRPRLPDAARRLRRPGRRSHFGEKALRLPAKNAPEAAVRVVRRFADEREAGETFRGVARPRRRRQGGRRRRCKDLDEFPTPDEAPEFYVDYGETGPVRRRDRRVGVRDMSARPAGLAHAARPSFTDDELAELNREFERLPGVEDHPVGGRQLRPAPVPRRRR